MKLLKTLLVATMALTAFLSCKKEENYYMTLSAKELSIGSDGGALTLDVKANVYYRVNNDCDFLTVTESATVGDTKTYTLNVQPNGLAEARENYIRFIGDYVTPLRVLIKQKAYIACGVDPKTLDAAWDATTASFEVLGEKAWTASIDNNWFSLNQTSGTTGGKVKLTFQKNETDTPQVGIVTVNADGQQFTVTITQKAKYSTSVEPAELTPAYDDTKASFTISTPYAWTASSDNSAFTLSATSGTGDATINVSFPENETQTAKVANITVTANSKTYTVKITQAAAPAKEFTDLSASGTSNCYIVSNVGYYKFKATVRGNGVVPASQTTFSKDITPVSVKVLWTTFNTAVAPENDDAVISKVKLEDGYIQFLYKGTNGNAVIAACDASGMILWSWHIWATEAPGTINVNGTLWMDRNLGAMCNNKKNDPLACGLFYQWGRKDPFRSSSTLDDTSGEWIKTTGSWPDPAVTVAELGTIDYVIKNPQAFLYCTSSKYNNKDWHWGTCIDDLWGGGANGTKTIKTVFDPCPQGYCVVAMSQATEIATVYSITKDNIDANNKGVGNGDWWYVSTGGLSYDSGTFKNVGTYVYVATSSVQSISYLLTRCSATAVNFKDATQGRAWATPIRCVKE